VTECHRRDRGYDTDDDDNGEQFDQRETSRLLADVSTSCVLVSQASDVASNHDIDSR
jgi:hypothetical protein